MKDGAGNVLILVGIDAAPNKLYTIVTFRDRRTLDYKTPVTKPEMTSPKEE